MNFGKSVGNFFALDIGTTAIRVVELAHSSSGWDLKHYGVQPIDSKLSESTAEHDRRELGETIVRLVEQSGIKTRDVAIGLPTNKIFFTVVELPTASRQELNNAIKYQLSSYIPLKVDESKADWAILGQSVNDNSKTEVLIMAVKNDYTESRLEFIESLGFSVVAIEPDSLAIVRSLLPDGISDGRLIIDMGESATDIIATLGTAPRLVRSIPIGLATLVRMAKQNLNVDEAQARQLVLKFGVSEANLNGQLSRALEPALRQFTLELTKSVNYFSSRYQNSVISSVLVSGYTSILTGFPEFISSKMSLQVQVATPWQHVNVPSNAQTSLAPISSQMAVTVGLAERLGI